MSSKDLNDVIKRAIGDAAFRRQLQKDPKAALKGFHLSAQESAAVSSGDPTKLSAMGVDQRMSKAFALGDATSLRGATASGLSGSARGANIPGEVDGQQFQDAGIATGGTGARSALISDGTSGTRGAISGDPIQSGRGAEAEDQGLAGLRGVRADDSHSRGTASDDMLSAESANRGATIDSGSGGGGRSAVIGSEGDDMLSADDANAFANARDAAAASATTPASDDYLAAEGHETQVGYSSTGSGARTALPADQADLEMPSGNASVAGSQSAGDDFLSADEANRAADARDAEVTPDATDVSQPTIDQADWPTENQ